MYESGFDLQRLEDIPQSVQEFARSETRDHHQERLADRRAFTQQIEEFSAEYQGQLQAILGADNLPRYREFRKSAKGRFQGKTGIERERRAVVGDSREFLGEIGVSQERVHGVQMEHLDRIQQLIAEAHRAASDHFFDPEMPSLCDPGDPAWTHYRPPYPGYFWSFNWDRSDEPEDPELARVLDPDTGRIGSSIRTRLRGADDDDYLNADYYTALKVWHQMSSSGRLEAYLAFRVQESAYSGSIDDEFGFSLAALNQWARPELRVLNPGDGWDIQTAVMFNVLEVVQGDGCVGHGRPWDQRVFAPNDFHWYQYRTEQEYAAGSWVLLEAGLENVTWFTSDDQSITTTTDLDLRLERVVVRAIGS